MWQVFIDAFLLPNQQFDRDGLKVIFIYVFLWLKNKNNQKVQV